MSQVGGRISSAPYGGGAVAAPFLAPNGVATAPSYSFTSEQNTGFFYAGGQVVFSAVNNPQVGFSTLGVTVDSAGFFGWTDTANQVVSGFDTKIFRDAARVVAQRDGVNANVFRVYETWTDASNYSRLAVVTAAGDFDIKPEAAGTGTLRGLNIGASGGDLCFYEGTPVALQTGVAVSAAGIHAALVALNLITA